MDEQQAPPDSVGKAPHAAGKPGDSEDKGYELPPPPAPGALWGKPDADEPAPRADRKRSRRGSYPAASSLHEPDSRAATALGAA